MMNFIPICIALTVILHTGCSNGHVGITQNAPLHNVKRQEKPSPEIPANDRKVVKESGWEIPGLSESEVVAPRTAYKGKESEGMFVTWKHPKLQKNGLAFLIKEEYFSEEERKVLGLYPGNYVVMKISQYDVSGREFYYVLQIHPDGVGAISDLYFYDEDGDGEFESVEHHRLIPSFVPPIFQWLQGS